ncbi:hypothetical protein BpHYR1_049635 [Brachionus plicatilis]|uniref:Uncharacterized protein n=1 Tax=Brachionus plicatilis TaxID=10195 RepID=A0A3M7T2F7_BRAPC|nr:hypothetical protein BpHYR1_049635 [Brachionus plicatilis]
MFLLKAQEVLNLKPSFVKSQMSYFNGQLISLNEQEKFNAWIKIENSILNNDLNSKNTKNSVVYAILRLN